MTVAAGGEDGRARIELLEMSVASERAAAVGIRADLEGQPIWRALLHRDKLAAAIYRLVTVQLFKSQLDPRIRELVIMRVAWRTGSQFEWAQHWQLAVSLGVPEAQLAAVRDLPTSAGFSGRDPVMFSSRDQVILQAADCVVDTGAICGDCWSRLAAVASAEECIDVTFAITTWLYVSSLLRTFEVPLPTGMPGWPPDGREPGVASDHASG